MCGRFLIEADWQDILERFQIQNWDMPWIPKGEMFPTQPVPVILDSGERKVEIMKWGFIPFSMKGVIINARSETVDSKGIFRNSFFHRRCLVPANGFYEWERVNGKCIKRRIQIKNVPLFAMAGIYNVFTDHNGKAFKAFTILTINACDEIRKIHGRMPVILRETDEKIWLNRSIRGIPRLKSILKPFSEGITIV